MMKFFHGKWNSLSPDEQAGLNRIRTEPEPSTEQAIVKLLSDILDRIDYIERTRHYHDPRS